jgi:hypothetical protein
MTPKIPLTDPRFVYTPAANTDLRKTFERVRAEMKKPVENVRPIQRKAK